MHGHHEVLKSLCDPTKGLRAEIPDVWAGFVGLHRAAVADGTPVAGGGNALLRGLGASPGIASGVVRVLTTPEEGERVRPGEVLVAPLTSPDWVPAIGRAAALVIEGGGITCHAAIVARELGVPCIVATRTATSTLHDGEIVTVDGSAGVIVQGSTMVGTAAATATT